MAPSSRNIAYPNIALSTSFDKASLLATATGIKTTLDSALGRIGENMPVLNTRIKESLNRQFGAEGLFGEIDRQLNKIGASFARGTWNQALDKQLRLVCDLAVAFNRVASAETAASLITVSETKNLQSQFDLLQKIGVAKTKMGNMAAGSTGGFGDIINHTASENARNYTIDKYNIDIGDLEAAKTKRLRQLAGSAGSHIIPGSPYEDQALGGVIRSQAEHRALNDPAHPDRDAARNQRAHERRLLLQNAEDANLMSASSYNDRGDHAPGLWRRLGIDDYEKSSKRPWFTRLSGEGSNRFRFAAQNVGFGVDDAIQSYQYGGTRASIRAASNNVTAIAGMTISNPITAAASVIILSAVSAALPAILDKFGLKEPLSKMSRTDRLAYRASDPLGYQNAYSTENLVVNNQDMLSRGFHAVSTASRVSFDAMTSSSFGNDIGSQMMGVSDLKGNKNLIGRQRDELLSRKSQIQGQLGPKYTWLGFLQGNTTLVNATPENELTREIDKQLEAITKQEKDLDKDIFNRQKAVEAAKKKLKVSREQRRVAEEADYHLSQQIAAGGMTGADIAGHHWAAANQQIASVNALVAAGQMDPQAGAAAIAQFQANAENLTKNPAALAREAQRGTWQHQDFMQSLNPEINPLRRQQKNLQRQMEILDSKDLTPVQRNEQLKAILKQGEEDLHNFRPSGSRHFISHGYRVDSSEDAELESRLVGNYGPQWDRKRHEGESNEVMEGLLRDLIQTLTISAANLGV